MKRPHLPLTLMLVGLAAIAMLTRTPRLLAQDSTGSAPPSAQTAAVPVELSPLKPGDVLRLRIWREPDLSGDFPIDETGTAILPRLGPTVVINIPADKLKAQLTESYKQFLNNPSIEITPLRRIAITGAVKNPGIYPVDPSITLGEAPTVAGGAVPGDSKRNVIELRRNGTSRQINIANDPKLARLPLASGDQVYIPERSWFSKNATWVVGTIIGVAGTTALILTRH